MSERELRRQMKRDCFRFMRVCLLVQIGMELLSVAAPTVIAWMMGDMTDYLIQLDVGQIKKHFPVFLIAVILDVVVLQLLHLWENLLLTKQGFAYDSYYMKRFICMSMASNETLDAGGLAQRLEEDVTEYYFNQLYIWGRPVVLLIYGAGMIYLFSENSYPFLYSVLLILLSAVPVIRSGWTGSRRAKLEKEKSEYEEAAKNLDLMIFRSRYFLKGKRLTGYALKKTEYLFERFMEGTGRKQYILQARDVVFGFFCEYGIQMLTLIAGLAFMAAGRMTAGNVFAGFLLLSPLSRCYTFAAELAGELKGEKAKAERLRAFYGIQDRPYEQPAPIRELAVKQVGFSYPGHKERVLQQAAMSFARDKNVWLKGPNGSGKSTLTLLLAGLYDPDEGSICSETGAGLTKEQLRCAVSYQAQNDAVFSGSIAENLFVQPDRLAEGADLLARMGLTKPLSYQVEAGGKNLSPGEQKKLILVRAIMKKADYLILDEPFNHLDQRGTEVLLDYLKARKGGVILISHQPMPDQVTNMEEISIS